MEILATLIVKSFSTMLCMLFTFKLSSGITLAIKKKLRQNPLRSFKDLNINRDRQREATLFYTCSGEGGIGGLLANVSKSVVGL
jgi:hypothetical protein